MFRPLALCLALLVPVTSASAADYSDPTWPCIQRKVESLSPGLMWAFPLDPASVETTAAQQADIAELAGYLSLRRVPLEDLEPRVAAFAETYGGDPEMLGLVFYEVFGSLSKRRSRIITGIGDFSLSQIALAEQIDLNRAAMDAQMAKAAPDFDAVDALEEQLDWDQLIYTDRQRNIVYLCETPTLLERRLFGIAQMLQRVVED